MTMRQRLAHIALGGVLVLSGMIASSFLQTADSQQSYTEIVKASEFHVLDENEATTAIIASNPAGLTIQNAAGKTAATIGTDLGDGFMSISNAAGKTAVDIGVDVFSDGGILAIRNAAGKTAATIGTDSDGGFMTIFNAVGKTVAAIGVESSSDGGVLEISNATGKRVAGILGHRYGGGLLIYNSLGKTVVGLGTDFASISGGSLILSNVAGKRVAVIGSHSDLGLGLSIFEPNMGEKAVQLGLNAEKNGGVVQVGGANGVAMMNVDEHGGWVGVYGKGNRTNKAVMGVDKDGNGAVSSWDKNGNHLGALFEIGR